MQEVLQGDKHWPESREDEQQVWVFHIHSLVGRVYLSVSGNTELGSTPNTEPDRMLLFLLSSSREVCSPGSPLLDSHSPRFLHLCWIWL